MKRLIQHTTIGHTTVKGCVNIVLCLVVVLWCNRASAQQTLQFSQYVFNGLAVNPAYAGYREDITLNLSSRLQWVGISGAPQTNTVSVDGLLNTDTKNVGLGIIATSDKLGPQNTSSIYGNYAYRLRLDDDDTRRLSFGLAIGLVQYSINGSEFSATDVNDASIPAGNQSKLTPDARLGAYYVTPSFYIGLSALNVLTGAGSFVDNPQLLKQNRHFYLTSGLLVPINETLDWKPSLMWKEDFKAPTNIDLSNYLLINKTLWIGASYRRAVSLWKKTNLQNNLDPNDAIAAMIRIDASSRLHIGYSYDFTLSSLASYQSGTHELSVSISFPGKKPRILSPRYF